MINEIEREEIYDFLEHVGVKGMRWGVITYNKRGYGGYLSKKQTKKALAVGLGTAAVSSILLKNGSRRTKAIGVTSWGLLGALAATQIMSIHNRKKVKDL